ncbi:hypothetical protein CTAYLR_003013 [Chrysophaeum taylorii]|uniref:Uncharacterized protein n=1 Tax=Chrysophaeum taylorii TaxID=2483200 RepID=A0AAD7U4W2_9STRA|nr:hypothetical protein CTAYLR_003013 [Chrysophaeum taylorii]
MMIWVLAMVVQALEPSNVRRLVTHYDLALSRRPIATKMATGAVVEVLGDALAQLFQERQLRPERSRAVCLDGVLTGLVLHHVYGVQDRLLPPAHLAWWVPFCHIIVDECLVDPAFVAGFIAITDCDWRRLIPTLKASKLVSLTTLPVQWLNFRFAPLRYRVFVVNLIDFLCPVQSSPVQSSPPRRKAEGLEPPLAVGDGPGTEPVPAFAFAHEVESPAVGRIDSTPDTSAFACRIIAYASTISRVVAPTSSSELEPLYRATRCAGGGVAGGPPMRPASTAAQRLPVVVIIFYTNGRGPLNHGRANVVSV